MTADDQDAVERAAEAVCRDMSANGFVMPLASARSIARAALAAAAPVAVTREALATLLAEAYPAGHLASDRATYLAHKEALRSQADAVLAALAAPTTDEEAGRSCAHCGEPLGAALPSGLFVHAGGLQRCQSPSVPYGHMGHPDMPCPAGSVNPCLGYDEGACDHLSRPRITTTWGEPDGIGGPRTGLYEGDHIDGSGC